MRSNQRLDLARAVARVDRARLLTAANVAAQAVTLHEAVASGRSYFVTPRPDLLVVDMDLPDDPTSAADVVAAFEDLTYAARRAGVPVVRVPSGRGGHEHAYLQIGQGGARVRLERWCRERGLDVRSQGIRPPGAPHRSGRPVPLSDDDARRALEVLTSCPDVEASTRLAAHLCPLTLPGRVRVAVRYGHQRAGYASASHARMALAVGVRARGGSLGLVEAVLNDVNSPLGDTFRARPTQWRHAELARIWSKAGVWIAGSGDRDRSIAPVLAALAAHPWPGQAGASDLSTMEELARVADRVGSRVVGVALADLAVGAGLSTAGARASVRRLVERGWLRVVSEQTARTTRVYELRAPGERAPGGEGDVPERDSFGDLGSDLARWRALGKSAMRVAREVAHGSASVPELCTTLQMSPACVRHHLRRLAAHGLVTSISGRWVARTSRRRLAALERSLDVEGCRLRQVQSVALARAARARARATLLAATRSWRAQPRADDPPPASA